MARPRYKQKCVICKNNIVIMYSSRQFPICSECHMKRIDQPIKDAKFKKMFDIPKEFYEQSAFLRNIKESCIRFENLTEKQIEAFKKAVKEMKNPPKEKKEGEA